MRLQHLTASHFRTMPWKNGGGSTCELAISPPSVSLGQAFDWRVSIATIEGSGPFSVFAGYDRHIAQLSGTPMTLTHKESGPKVLVREYPYAFSGDWQTEGRIEEGPVTDFNLMMQRELGSSELKRLEIKGREVLHLAPANFLYMIEGRLRDLDGTLTEMSSGEAWVIENPSFQTLRVEGEGRFYWARILPKDQGGSG